jgi:hypothetical protein
MRFKHITGEHVAGFTIDRREVPDCRRSMDRRDHARRESRPGAVVAAPRRGPVKLVRIELEI